MNIKNLSFCLSIALLGTSGIGYAQGSADPGLSTIGAMRTGAAIMVTDEVYENEKGQIALGHTFAEGDKGVMLNITHIEGRIPFSTFGYLEAKLPVYRANGDFGKISGLGDAALAYTHYWANPERFTFQVTGGVHIGMGNANTPDYKGRPLPMVYQPSLGTTDVVVGGSVTWKKYLTLSAGYQQPFIRYTENDYNRFSVINDLEYSTADYPLSRKLHRNGDVVVRLEGNFNGSRAGISAGPVAFYHLKDDLYKDINDNYRKLAGSEGFTLNLAGNAFLRFGRYGECKLDVSGAYNLVQRDLSPDGLLRKWMVTPRFTYFFGQNVLLF